VPAPAPRTGKKARHAAKGSETLWVRNERTGRARRHQVLKGSRKRGDAIICPLPLGEDADGDDEPWTVAYPRPDIEWGHTFRVDGHPYTVSRFELGDDLEQVERHRKGQEEELKARELHERMERERKNREDSKSGLGSDWDKIFDDLDRDLAKKFPKPDTDAIVETLGLKTWPASRSEIRNAYRHKSKILHPDCGGDEKAFVELTAAKVAALKICPG